MGLAVISARKRVLDETHAAIESVHKFADDLIRAIIILYYYCVACHNEAFRRANIYDELLS